MGEPGEAERRHAQPAAGSSSALPQAESASASERRGRQQAPLLCAATGGPSPHSSQAGTLSLSPTLPLYLSISLPLSDPLSLSPSLSRSLPCYISLSLSLSLFPSLSLSLPHYLSLSLSPSLSLSLPHCLSLSLSLSLPPSPRS